MRSTAEAVSHFVCESHRINTKSGFTAITALFCSGVLFSHLPQLNNTKTHRYRGVERVKSDMKNICLIKFSSLIFSFSFLCFSSIAINLKLVWRYSAFTLDDSETDYATRNVTMYANSRSFYHCLGS